MTERLARAPTGVVQQSDADGITTERFSRVRSAHSSEILEDYTELIADLLERYGEARTTDIARHLGVTLPTSNKALARLKREGLIVSRPYRGVFLTEAGQVMADRVKVRHRLVVDLLVAVGVPPEAAEMDAEGIEHHVSETTLEAFRDFVRRHEDR